MQDIIPLCVLDGEDEPRVRDIDLADKLGMSRPRDIRGNLIKCNLEELSRYGNVRVVETRPPEINGLRHGSVTTEYWLNELQAGLICMRSNSPNAPDAREAILRAWQAWRRGPSDVRLAIADLQREIAELRKVRDPRIACRDRMTVKQVTEVYLRIPRKGRGRELSRIRYHLDKWHKYWSIPCPIADSHGVKSEENTYPIDTLPMWAKDFAAWKAEREIQRARKVERQRTMKFPALISYSDPRK